MEGTPEVLTAQEVADLLRCNLRTVYALLKHGKLHGVRIGQQAGREKGWRIPRAEVERFLSGTESGRPEAACPDGLTEDQKKRILAYEDGLPEEVREGIHRNSPIVAWRCKACWHVTYVPEFTTGGKTPPAYCSECGMKATPGNLALPDNFIYEGRYEAAQPWEDTRPPRRRRARRKKEA